MIKPTFCWLPVKLCKRVPEEERIEHIGWVWLKWAQVLPSFSKGRITFPENVNPPKVCKGCGRKLEVK